MTMTASDTTKAASPLIKRIRSEAVILIVLFAVAAISWSPRLSGPIDLRYDAGLYFILGTSLAEGRGYRLLNEPGDIEATQYPPLLPFIVAAHQWVLGTRDVIAVGHWLRLTFFLIYLAFSLCVYLTLRKYLPLGSAFLATLICLLSLYTYLMSNQLAAEVLFGLTTTLFFLCHRKGDGRAAGVVSFVLATASYALRTVGVALFAAWVAEALLEKRWRRALLRLTLSLIPIICWQSYIYRVESGRDYQTPAYEYQRADYLFYNVSYAKNISLKNSFSPELGRVTIEDVLARFGGNLKRMPASIGEAVTVERKVWVVPFAGNYPRKTGLVLTLTLTLLGCLVLGGVVLQLVRRQWMIPLYVLLSIAIICLTPWPIQLVRYLTPLCPFLVLALFTSLLYLQELSSKVLPAASRAAGVFLIASVVSLILVQQLIVFYQAHTGWVDEVIYDRRGGGKARHPVFGYFPAERALDAGLDWLMKRAGEGEVVAVSAPPWVYLRTGLEAVMPPFEINPEKAQKLLDSVPVTYLLLEEENFNINGRTTAQYVRPVIERHPELWEQIYSAPDGKFRIYRRAARRPQTLPRGL